MRQKAVICAPRFSPGYGDFPLECQGMLLEALEAGKRIGIKLTDSLLMMPSKSVSAVMGASRKPYRCDVKAVKPVPRRTALPEVTGKKPF